MKSVILVTRDHYLGAEMNVVACNRKDVRLVVEPSWEAALRRAVTADMLVVDLLAVLDAPNKIAGYVQFAEAKMASKAAGTPVALIGVPESYRLDGMAGWPGFLTAFIDRPISRESLEYVLDHL